MKFSSYYFIGERRRLAFATSTNNPEALPQLEAPEKRKESLESLDPKRKAGELQSRATKQMEDLQSRTKRTETEAEKLRKLANTDDLVTEAKDATVIGLLTPDAHTKPNLVTQAEIASVEAPAEKLAKEGEQQQLNKEKIINPESLEKPQPGRPP